jgi:hypothetical protein
MAGKRAARCGKAQLSRNVTVSARGLIRVQPKVLG